MTANTYFSFDFINTKHYSELLWSNNSEHSVSIEFDVSKDVCYFGYYEKGVAMYVPTSFNAFSYTDNGLCFYGVNKSKVYVNKDGITLIDTFGSLKSKISMENMDGKSLCEEIIIWFLKCVGGYEDFGIIGDLIVLPTNACEFSVLHIKDSFDNIKVEQISIGSDELRVTVPELYGQRSIYFSVCERSSYVINLNIFTCSKSVTHILKEVIKRRKSSNAAIGVL